MYKRPSKKRQIITRIFVYSGMSLGVVILVSTLILYMLGYRIDSKDGVISQSGLVQFDTTPRGATIEIDGKKFSIKTPTKSSVSSGPHEFVMWRDGYETWRKELDIKKGTLTWLSYGRLVPKQKPVEAVASFEKAADSLAAPEGRFMALIPDAAAPEVQFFNLQNETIERTVVAIPHDKISGFDNPETKHVFSMTEWDQSGRYLLVNHVFGDKHEWLVIDRQDGALKHNLTKIMDIDASEVHFSGRLGNQFFALVSGDIRKIDLDQGTLSRPMAQNVAEMSMYGEDYVGFVSEFDQATKQRLIGFVRSGSDEPVIVSKSTSSPDTQVHVRLMRYFGKDFIAIADGKTVSIVGGTFPDSTEKVPSNLKPVHAFTVDSGINWLLASDSGRFVVAQSGASFVSFDLERQSVSLPATLAGASNPEQLDWLDGFYVWSDRSGQLVLREFDGANQHTINQVVPGFDATLSPNGRYLYSVGKNQTGFQLQRVKMILE